MWLAKLKIKHNCTIGTRCEKFSCISHSFPLTSWTKGNYEYVLGEHILIGEDYNIKKFIKDLKKDPRVVKIEQMRNVIHLLEKNKQIKIPARLYRRQFFLTKPVYVDKGGFEFWEIASFEKKILMDYIGDIEKQKSFEIEMQKIIQTKIKSVWYEKTMPLLSEKQKRAFELATEKGYYKFPKKTNLGKLAKIMKISTSTFQEHLRKAEAKIIPSHN
jgi:predicted DNA binding protein